MNTVLRTATQTMLASDNSAPSEYLIVVPVRFHRVSASSVAGESAFCEHLRMLLRLLGDTFDSLTVASPAMDPAEYERNRGHLGVIDEASERIRWVALHPANAGTPAFWLQHFVPGVRKLWREVRRAELLHTGTSHNLMRPVEFTALLMAALLGKKSMCVVDMDLRNDARMNYATKTWSLKSMLLCRGVYDPLRHLQLLFASSHSSLVLLKGRKLCEDYGRGRPHVKYFLDAAFSTEHLIPPELLAAKQRALADPSAPLELVYFGRLAHYKGVDLCLRALARAVELTSAPVRLRIVGGGEEGASLRRLCTELGLDEVVEFREALPFGPRLFAELYPRHLLLAAPRSEDTPRSALDAMACGIPILAFDTRYYTDLQDSGAVDVVPWPSVERLAERIVHYAEDKQRLLPLTATALEFARANTQETWLSSRVRWTEEVMQQGRHGAPAQALE